MITRSVSSTWNLPISLFAVPSCRNPSGLTCLSLALSVTVFVTLNKPVKLAAPLPLKVCLCLFARVSLALQPVFVSLMCSFYFPPLSSCQTLSSTVQSSWMRALSVRLADLIYSHPGVHSDSAELFDNKRPHCVLPIAFHLSFVVLVLWSSSLIPKKSDGNV